MNKENLTQGQKRQFTIVIAFVIVCFIWGSTYLAIRFAIETLPPFLMASSRFLVAGAILYSWLRLRGTPRPSLIHWRSAFIIGSLLLLGGNGAVTWAEQYVPSSMVALLVATIPLWITGLSSALSHTRLQGSTIGSMLLAMFGILLLVGPEGLMGGQGIHPMGVAAVLFAAFSWALGTLYAREAAKPSSSLLGTAMNLLAGGFVLGIFGLINGEAAQVNVTAVSLKSWLALGYLIVFGSIIAFSAYIWLMQNANPSRVASYAYINPLVAVILGWLLAGETITLRTIAASIIIVTAVAWLITFKHKPKENTEIIQEPQGKLINLTLSTHVKES